MALRAKPLRALSLSLLVTVAVALGFVVADFARGEYGGRPSTSGPIQATPAVAAAPKTAPSDWLGRSGRLRAYMETPSALTSTVQTQFAVEEEMVDPGVHDFGIVTPKGDPFYVLALLPYGEKTSAMLRGYRIGSWPTKSNSPRYAPPAGFIEVTPENELTPVSEHFKLRDFLTHDQVGVWPKFLVLKPRLLDKLELISEALAERGLPSRLHVMSGFRTPQYNQQGVGEGGRASLSRHMYGDAADVFVDEDGNGMMDDLNGDGRVTVQDSRVLYAVAEGVEGDYPELVGGLSPYPANSAHGPFVHVDARGVRARW